MNIPDKEHTLLLRSLGLLLNQIAIYGQEHKVVHDATNRVFLEIKHILNTYGAIEIALIEDRFLVNGQATPPDFRLGHNLAERFVAHDLSGITLEQPMGVLDFSRGIKLLNTAPSEVQELGGFRRALQAQGIHHITVATASYRRVTDGSPNANSPSSQTGGIEELSAAWELDFERTAAPPPPVASRPNDDLQQMASRRQQHASQLAQLLRETAQLLEQDGALNDQEQHAHVLQAITKIRDEIIASTAHSERNIAVLADQVDNDRMAIDDLEAAARRHGLGIKLTRGELISRYAELNQEIVQPLTVTAGVVELLGSGKTGELTEAQSEMLALAQESIKRVNQLVAYMSRIAGLPASYTPDATIINDTYRTR